MSDESSSTSQPSTRNAGDRAQQIQPEQPGRERNNAVNPWQSRVWSRMSLSHVQAIVGTLTGLVTVAGALYSFTQFVRPAATTNTAATGEVLAVVQEAASQKSVTDATIEILTPSDALVATLTPDSSGRARQSLREGTYAVRVTHPRYSAEVRQIQVFPGQTVEVKATLHAGSSLPIRPAGRAVKDGVRALGRLLGH